MEKSFIDLFSTEESQEIKRKKKEFIDVFSDKDGRKVQVFRIKRSKKVKTNNDPC